MKRYIPLIIIVLTLLLTLATCERTAYVPVRQSVPGLTVPPPDFAIGAPDQAAKPESPHEPTWTGPVNPLTGLPTDVDMSQTRPVAIMINNLRRALPQLGVSQADIIYEVPVEGGETRMLAVFQDVSDIGYIGSVRSARPYFVDLAQGHDAVFIFAGGSHDAYRVLSERSITRLDGVNGGLTHIFFRNQDRRRAMGYEHSMLTSGELISQHLPTYNFRLEHNEGFEHTFTFTDDATPQGGSPAESVNIIFSSAARSTSFSWDAESRHYYVSQQGGPYVDGNCDTQLTMTNVIVLRTTVQSIDREGRLRITLTGSGSGYFINGGEYVEITWSKESPSAPFVFTLSDGSPLIVGQGRTYIGIVPNNATVSIN